jgi:23S rRNA pseudouridine1911/1915/1917 synthase
MNEERISVRIEEEEAGRRIDAFLSSCFEERSRTFIKKLIEDGRIKVIPAGSSEERSVKPSYPVSEDDLVLIDFPEPEALSVEPEDIPVPILYEDSDLLIVNKPKGMVVHPSYGHQNGTLVNALLYHCSDLSGINGVLRPGIVHRIDKDTTGLLVVCKNDCAHQKIAAQFADHSQKRIYEGIVTGNLKEDEGTVDAPIGRDRKDRKKMAVDENGRPAVTHYRVLERFGTYTYAEFSLTTGRTHQIRVHMASLGHPILGDEVYGSGRSPFKTEGQVLHARLLGFIHPSTGAYVEFSAPHPEDFERILRKLRTQKQ